MEETKEKIEVEEETEKPEIPPFGMNAGGDITVFFPMKIDPTKTVICTRRDLLFLAIFAGIVGLHLGNKGYWKFLESDYYVQLFKNTFSAAE